MRQINLMNIKRTLFGVIAGLALLAAPQVHAAAFIKFDRIDGEATDSNHDKWIDVLAIDWGIIRDVDPASGQLRSAKPKPVTCIKELDKSSPKLMEALVTGQPIATVIVELTIPTMQGQQPYLKYELKNVLITSYSTSGDAGDVPTEDFSLNFEEIKVTYTQRDEAGRQVGDPVVTTWDTTPEPQ